MKNTFILEAVLIRETERERDRQTERQRERDRERETEIGSHKNRMQTESLDKS